MIAHQNIWVKTQLPLVIPIVPLDEEICHEKDPKVLQENIHFIQTLQPANVNIYEPHQQGARTPFTSNQ